MALKILFVSHEATRTGAPMVLLHLLTWLKINTDIKLDVLLLLGGPLENDFRKFDNFFLCKSQHESLFSKVLEKAKTHVLNIDSQKEFLKRFKSNKYDMIYGNTAVTASALELLKKSSRTKTILHVHELENVIKNNCGDTFSASKQYIDKYIACSKIVQDNLEQTHGITNTDLIHGFVPSNPVIKSGKATLKKQLKIPENSVVIGGSGTLGWRKGFDYYLFVAQQLIKKNDHVYFVWVGGEVTSQVYNQYLYDIKNMGLYGKVIITGDQPNPLEYFNLFDVFLMTSKEDPFPLVCIENALLKKPIILFNKGVGSAEFIDNQVDYLDVDAMVQEVQKYIDDVDLREKDGLKLYENAQAFTLEKSAKKVYDLILDLAE